MSREWIGRGAALFLSLLLMAGVEVGCRFFEAPEAEQGPLQSINRILDRDDTFFWVPKKGLNTPFFGKRIHLDRFGFRNPDGEPTRSTPEEFRVLILGASPSFGWGVREEVTYARLLEERLAGASPRKVRVFNASVIGYSSWQGLQVIKRYINVFRPNQVIVSFGINDVTRERFFYSGPREDKELKIRFASIENLISRSAFARLIVGWKSRLSGGGVTSKNSYPVRVSQEDFLANHREILRTAEAAGAKSLLLIIPFHFPDGSVEIAGIGLAREAEARALTYFEALRNFSRREGIPLVDASRVLMSDYDSHFLVHQQDFIHPSEKGHRVIAELLWNSLANPRISEREGAKEESGLQVESGFRRAGSKEGP